MTQVFGEDGRVERVTVVEAGPCRVTGIRTHERDGYEAVQLAFGEVSEKALNKPLRGHLKKADEDFIRNNTLHFTHGIFGEGSHASVVENNRINGFDIRCFCEAISNYDGEGVLFDLEPPKGKWRESIEVAHLIRGRLVELDLAWHV